MSVKSLIKRAVVGKPGVREQTIPYGLLRGLRFTLDSNLQGQRVAGLYEREIAPYLRDYSARAVSALDVGTNDGWYALYLASRPSIRHVYGFDPDPKNTDALERNFAGNDPAFRKKLTIYNKFVGNRD